MLLAAHAGCVASQRCRSRMQTCLAVVTDTVAAAAGPCGSADTVGEMSAGAAPDAAALQLSLLTVLKAR